MRLGLAIPLAAGRFQDLVGALVQSAIKLADQGQRAAFNLRPAQDGEDFGVDFYAAAPA
ncbi:MAG: hypothetical protein NTV11_20395 [Rhodocyclales bacterium]|nr:hypothetical protein [Rhodocyclales bacterium]